MVWDTDTCIGLLADKELKIRLPENPNTDTKVTSEENHYEPVENTGSNLKVSGTNEVISGIKRDTKGHITGVNTKTIPLENYLTITKAENTYATNETVNNINNNITNIQENITNIQNDSEGFLTIEDLSIYALNTSVENINNTIKNIQQNVTNLQTQSSEFLVEEDLSEYAKISSVPTKTSDLVNNSGFITSADSVAMASKLGTATIGGGTKPMYLNAGSPAASNETIGSANKPVYLNAGTITACANEIPTKTSDLVNDSGFVTTHQDLSGYQPKGNYATLGEDGKVPASQLPSYVDDVLEYTNKNSFPNPGETGKIYIDTTSNLTYRWSGSAYIEISQSLALGETSSTAYAGDKGAAVTTNFNTHNSDNTRHITAAERTAWNAKQDAISDLATIRTNSTNGNTAYGWGNHASAGYTKNAGTVTSVAMTVPTGLSVSGSPVTSSGTLAVSFASGYSIPTTDKQAAWDGKQDAISDIATIRTNSTNGNTSYGWGNHASAGYTKNTGTVTSVSVSVPTGLSVTGSPVTSSGTIAISLASGYSIPTTANQTTWSGKQDAISDLATIRSNATNGNTAYGWGNHADAGYTKNSGTVTSVAMSVPTGLSVTGTPVTSSGTLAVTFATGYSIPTTAKQAAWDGKQDAISDLATIRSNATNGNTAYGWGNHASANYIKGTIEVVTLTANNNSYDAGTIASGSQKHVIFVNNSTSADYIVTIPTTYKTPDGAAIELTVPQGGYCEANFLNMDGTIYVRGV